MPPNEFEKQNIYVCFISVNTLFCKILKKYQCNNGITLLFHSTHPLRLCSFQMSKIQKLNPLVSPSSGSVDSTVVEHWLCILWDLGSIPGGYPEKSLFQEELREDNCLPARPYL